MQDDRKLSYAVYGPEDGKPVLYYHGTPSSRKELLLLQSYGIDAEKLLFETGLKLIAPDRGALTTYHPQRNFLSFTNDAVQLLQHLGVTQCSVLCWSGGGPYALATAYRFPQLVDDVYILCGITKQFGKAVLRQMGLNKWYFLCSKYAPVLLGAALNVMRRKKIISLPEQRFTGLPYVDYNLLQKKVKQAAELTLKESTRRGIKAAVHEARMYFDEYNFSVKDIQQPIHYWWGTLDMNVVELHAREIEQHAQRPVMHYREGEGHLSLYVNYFGEALQTIAQANRISPGR